MWLEVTTQPFSSHNVLSHEVTATIKTLKWQHFLMMKHIYIHLTDFSLVTDKVNWIYVTLFWV